MNKDKERAVAGLIAAVTVAVIWTGIGSTAPVVDPWGGWQNICGSKSACAIWADTLGMLSSDSVGVTDSIPVNGARAIYLSLQSDGATGTGAFNGGSGVAYDSLAVPILQVRFPNGQWQSISGTHSGVFTLVATSSATSLVNQQVKIGSYVVGEDAGAGTPYPLQWDYIRWRLKSANARRFATAAGATLAPSGTIRARVWKAQ